METNNLPKSRAEAKRLGVNRYFTGKPCCRGHIADRHVHGSCYACLREDQIEWRKTEVGRKTTNLINLTAKRRRCPQKPVRRRRSLEEIRKADRARKRAEQLRNPEHFAAMAREKAKRRYAATRRNVVSWSDLKFIREFYGIARRISQCMGVRWQVDHVIPVQGPSVCGLHVQSNLRLLPAVANRAKSNRLLSA